MLPARECPRIKIRTTGGKGHFPGISHHTSQQSTRRGGIDNVNGPLRLPAGYPPYIRSTRYGKGVRINIPCRDGKRNEQRVSVHAAYSQ